MAEKNSKTLTPFEQEKIECAKKVLEYKLAPEANVVSIIYKHPEEIRSVNLDLSFFSHNVWKVYWQIASDIIVSENKETLDEITIGLYLEKHPKLREKYEEYGGYKTILSATEYVDLRNLDGYIKELGKWKVILQLVKEGFPVKDRLSEFVDMDAEDIYDEYETYLNHVFINIDTEIKSFNIFDGIHSLIDDLNDGVNVGMPLYNAPLLTNEIGGLQRGNIYGLGAGSGVGKSTMIFNYIVPSAVEYNEKVVFIINEEDETKFKKELIIWVANNVFNEDLQKYKLRNGKFSEETMALLRKCADWIEGQKDKNIFTVIPLNHYSVNKAIKIINKYSSINGADSCHLFVLDTLKESFDSTTDEIYKSMMRDMIKLYDAVKPSAKNVCLVVSYQLGKGSLKSRHLSNFDIGQARSIVDVMSVNLMMRRPFDDEYTDERNELKCWRLEGANGRTKIPIKTKKDDNLMITFINKNRHGSTDQYQILSTCDLSRNKCKDIGYCLVPQDW